MTTTTTTRTSQICISSDQLKNSSFTRFTGAFFIFVRFVSVLVLSTLWNDLFWSCMDKVSTWPQFFNFLFFTSNPQTGYSNSISSRGPFLERSEKPFVKLRPVYSVRLVVSYLVRGIKIKITAKFRASIRLRFEDTKRIMSPEMRPKRFGTFEKRASGH